MSRCRLTLLCLLAGIAGCMEGQKPNPLKRESLYDRLGGTQGISRVVDRFVENVAEDPLLDAARKRPFKEGGGVVLRGRLVDYIGRETGGPHRYAPAEPPIPREDFGPFVPALREALNRNDIREQEQKELLRILAPRHTEVIE